GLEVKREFRIGQREIYVPEIEAGSIDVFPEYTGPLLQYWKGETGARSDADVYSELTGVVPEGMKVLDAAPARDQDSYAVTSKFAEKWGLSKISDLAKVTDPMTMGANSEAEQRPNGPQGLAEAYGVKVDFTPIEDGGGPLTLSALKDGDIQLAILYSADPAISQNDVVILEDDAGLFLSSNVVPVVSDRLPESAVVALNGVSAKLTTEDLIELNQRSVGEQLPAETIAREWRKKNLPDAS
ncbi:MAG: glycine/betaine ABC transporter, partial [Actinobacteria bacterium]